MQHRSEHKHDLAAAAAAIGEPLECSRIYLQVMSSGDGGSHLPVFVFPVKTGQNSLWWHLQTHDMPKRINFTNIQGKLIIRITQISVNHPLTCHRCKCRRYGASHLECSSSAGTGCKETKGEINYLCKVTPR